MGGKMGGLAAYEFLVGRPLFRGGDHGFIDRDQFGQHLLRFLMMAFLVGDPYLRVALQQGMQACPVQ